MTKAATASIWEGRVAAWRASGETAAAFAHGRGYSPRTLRWWSSRLGRRVDFVRLVPTPAVSPAATAASALVVEVGGVHVRVAPGFDAALLAQVVAALRGAAR
jgi:hypothetical protein